MSISPAIVQLNFPAMQSLAAAPAQQATPQHTPQASLGGGGAPAPGNDTFQRSPNPASSAFFLPPTQANAFK